eukprot:gene16994-20224_t
MVFRKLFGNLTPKMGNKNYYKGRGVRNQGSISSTARFKLEISKMQVINTPDLTECELKPYVSRHYFYNTPEETKASQDLKKQSRQKKQEQLN